MENDTVSMVEVVVVLAGVISGFLSLTFLVLGLAPLLSSVVPSFGPLEVGLLVEGLFEALENISKGSLCNLVITVRFEAVAYSSWFYTIESTHSCPMFTVCHPCCPSYCFRPCFFFK